MIKTRSVGSAIEPHKDGLRILATRFHGRGQKRRCLARYWRTKMEEQDFIVTPEDAQLARRKRRIIVIGSVVLVLAILFGVFARRPTGHAIRAWQARRHAQKAFAFISKEQWSDARSEAMAAYKLSPDQPEALRAVARYFTRRIRSRRSISGKRLSKKTSLTRLDVRDEAMIAIIAGDIALADSTVRQLIDSHAAGRLAARSATGDREESARRSKILPAENRGGFARDRKRAVPGNAAATLACSQQPERAGKCCYASWKISRGENRDIARRACCRCAKHALRTR